MMRILKSGLLLTAATLLLPVAAYAAPVTGTAVPPSSFGLTISAGALGTASGSGAVTGTSSTTFTLNGTGTTLTTTAGGGVFNVADFTAPGLALGTIALDNFKLNVALPSSTSTSGGPSAFDVDLGGTVVTVNQGLVIQGGTSTLFDFSKTPTTTTAPAGSLTTLTPTTWTIPFTSTSTENTLGIPVDIIIKTDLVISAPAGGFFTPVPEAGTVVLLGAGLTGLVALGRRKRS